ncbi:hypothetical protein H4R35_000067 [Dimargaris xerosporica]|nr:hypothetical protein H4R35_000067 [Dimargaris xerosporica]
MYDYGDVMSWLVIGELYIGGPGVSPGYLNRPDLNATKFIANPYGEGRLYATGDLGRWLSNGEVECLGRIDAQVKVPGYRIEPAEVTDALIVQPAVTANAAQVCAQQPVAFATPKDTDTTVVLNAWTTQLQANILASTRSQSPQLDALQQAVGQVLGMDPATVNPSLSFIQLGGGSISAIQLSSQLKQLHYNMPIPAILERMPLRDLADTMAECQVRAASTSLSEPARDAPIPLTPIQATFFGWSFHNPHHFNQSFVIELTQPLSCDQLNDALQQLVGHHAILRSQFTQTADGDWVQHLAPSTDMLEESLADVITSDRASLHAHLVHVQRKLDLTKGRLMRGALIELQSDDQTPPTALLFLTAHHLVVDLVSWRILLNDLYSLLQKQRLAPVPVSFGAWACALQGWGKQWTSDGTACEWTLSLPSIDPICLDLNTEGNCVTAPFILPTPLTALFTQLESYSKCFSVTPTELLLASLAQALHRVSTDHTVTIWHENHGRHPWSSAIDLSRTIGRFTALYPVTLTVDASWSHACFLRRIKHALHTLPHHGLVHGIQRMKQSNWCDSSTYQRMDVLFNYLGKTTDQPTLTLQGQAPWTRRPDLAHGLLMCDENERRPQLLEVLAYQQDDAVQFDLLYCPQVIASATVAALTNELQQALHDMLIGYAHHDEALYWTPSDFPLLDLTWDDLNTIGHELAQQNIDPTCVEAIYPCLPLQEGLLLPLIHDPAAYLVQAVMSIHGPLDTSRFQRAWVRLIQRHPILRTRFICPSLNLFAGILQVVLSSWTPVWTIDRGNANAIDVALFQYSTADLAHGFQLTQPLLRLALFRVSALHHRFVLTAHHAISDSWSLELMLAEIKTLYNDRTIASPGAYRDVISYVVNHKAPEALTFWRQYLQSILVPSYLPSPHAVLSAAMQPCFDPESFSTVTITTTQHTNLMQWAQHHGVTLSTALCAAWAIVLHLYTDQTNVVFGVTVSGRSIPVDRLKHVVGPCINTLPCCAEITSTTTIVELVAALHQASIAMAPCAHWRLADIQAQAAIDRGQPLFNTVLSYESYPTPPLDPACSITFETDTATYLTEYPLTIVIRANADGLECSFTYRRDHSPCSYMHQVARHFATALRALATESDGKLITRLDLLSSQEKSLVLGKYAANSCNVLAYHAHQYILARVRTHPDALALRDSLHEITYAQLDGMASGIAADLAVMAQVGSDRIVAIVADNFVELVVGQLAVWKTGCAFVVIDPRYPPDRKRFIFEDAQCIAVMGLLAHLGAIDPSVPWLCLDDLHKHYDHATTIPTFDPPPPTALAWVAYTSGATGQPKGVMAWAGKLTPTLLAPTVDVAISEIWTTLSFGDTVWVVTVDEIHDAVGQVSRICCTPLLSTLSPERYPNLTQVTVTGECLPPALANRDDHPAIGHPLPNTQGYILNKHLRPVPPGVVGELYIGGPGVAREYLHQPKLTAEKFVTNPLGSGCLFKSGDLARWLPDGRVECLGRCNGQITVRGYRITLGEVTNLLTQHSMVQHAHVVTQGAHLVAYVTPETVDPETLLSTLRQNLPHYMVPSAITPLATWPLTSGGKVDLHALAANGWEPAARSLMLDTKSPWHGRVISLLALALNRPAATIHLEDDFFALGGNSLTAIRLGSLCRDQGLSLSIPRLFERPRVYDIADHMAEESISHLSVDSLAVTPFSLVDSYPITTLCHEIASGLQLPPDTIENVLPTSALQAQFLSNTHRDPSVCMVQLAFTIAGAVDPDRYHSVWRKVFQRHSSLRTKFWVTDRVAPYHSLQVVTTTTDFSWQHIVVPNDPTNRTQLEKGWLEQDRRLGFQLDGSPLFRLALVTLTPTTHTLFMTFHPALLDTWSVHHILAETVALYGDQPLALPVSYAGFICHVQADDEEQSRALWTTLLKGVKPALAPTLPLPNAMASTSAKVTAVSTYHTWSCTLSMDWDTLKAFGHRHHLTITTLLQATWALVLGRYLGEPSEVTFGMLVSGRSVPIVGIEQMVGMTANTVPCRVLLPHDLPALAWLTQIQEYAVAMQTHEHTSLVHIARWTELPGAHALIQSLLAVIKAPRTTEATLTMAPSSFRYQPSSSNHVMEYPLMASFIEDDSLLRIELQYDSTRYATAYMQYLSTFIDHSLDLLLHYGSTCYLQDLFSLAPDEAAQLYDWSLGPSYPTDPNFQWLDQAFTRTVHRSPDAIALEAGDYVWTYAQVAYQAQRLTKQLQSHRIAHGAPVVLLFTRSPPFVSKALCGTRDPSNLAYIIYSSDPTSTPKGVPVRHESVVNTIEQMVTIMALDASCRCLQAQSIAADVCVMELFSTFAAGGTVVLSMTDITQDLAHGNTCHLTASLLAVLDADLYPNLTCVANIGDALPAAVAKRWRPGRRFFNCYGSTEVAIASHVERICPLETVTMGPPLPNTRCFVLDSRRLLAPVGVVGQVCLAGNSVSDGYWKQPGHAMQAFALNPFGPGQLYLTGDQGCWLPTGKLKVLSCQGGQVQLHGRCIELADVEQVIYQHPAVQMACVMVQYNQLVGFVTPADISVVHVRELIRQQLPLHMHLSAVIALPQMPLTPMGKVDCTALSMADLTTTHLRQTAELPPIASIDLFIAIVAQVLGRDSSTVNTEATFFQLGGHSRLARELVAQCHQAGLQLALGDITHSHMLVQLAALIEMDPNRLPTQAASPTPLDTFSGPMALTPVQQEPLRMELVQPNALTVPMLFRVHGMYSLPQWQTAIDALVTYHDMLRFRLLFDPHGPASSGYIDAPANDMPQYFSHVVVPTWEKLTSILTQQGCKVHYDRGPICHFTLFTRASTQYLLIVVHHLAADQTSMAVLAEDLEALLQNRPLTAKTMAYPAWSQMLPHMLNDEALSSGAPSKQPALPLPRDMPGPLRNTTLKHQQQAVLTIEGSLLDQLHRARLTYEAPMVPLLLTGLLMAVEREFQQTLLTLAFESHGRTAPYHDCDVSRTVGWFTRPCCSTLTMQHEQDGARAIAATQQALQKMTDGALCAYLAQTHRESTPSPPLPGDRPEMAFSYVRAEPEASERSRQRVLQPCPNLLQPSLPDLLPNARPYLMVLSCHHRPAALRLQITYHTNQFWATTIHRVLLTWIQALDALTNERSALAG